MGSVVEPVLALLHLELGRAAEADHSDAASELRQPLLQLLTIIVRGCLLDSLADLRAPAPGCRPSCRRRR
jgi:hypothetical protein